MAAISEFLNNIIVKVIWQLLGITFLCLMIRIGVEDKKLVN
jgi:hypothetical protein